MTTDSAIASRPLRALGVTRWHAVTATLAAAVLFALALALVSASAAQAAPKWRIASVSNTTVQPGELHSYRIKTTNVGDTATNGDPIVVTIELPDGLTVADPGGEVSDPASPHAFFGNYFLGDFPASGGYPCTAGDGSPLVGGESSVRCENNVEVPSQVGHQIVWLPVSVAADATPGQTLTTELEVSGGGAGTVTTVDPSLVSVTEPDFGVDAFDGGTFAANGDVFTQAAGTPHSASVAIDFNTRIDPRPVTGRLLWPAESLKDVFVDLPPGLVGSPASVDECTATQLANVKGAAFSAAPTCPVRSQVGTVTIRVNDQPYSIGTFPLFNMDPPPGVAGRFGFHVVGSVVVVDAEVRSDGDYGLTAVSRNTSQGLALAGVTTEFWGVPADVSHDPDRACPGELAPTDFGPLATDPACAAGYERPDAEAFLRNPTSCVGPLDTDLAIASWQNPGDQTSEGDPDLSDPEWETGSFTSHQSPGYPATPDSWGAPIGVTGCEAVPFRPDITVTPTTTQADSPTGLEFDLSMLETSSLSNSDLKKAVVTLPEGMVVNPSSADGLQGCSLAQIDLDGQNTEPSCPKGSKIGTVVVDTPLLKDPLDGSVYLASQSDNPFGSLLAMYIVARGPGTVVKLAGRISADPQTGRLTTTFDNQPQLPFDNLHLELFDGPRAPLITPKQCGSYTVAAELSPWARPNSPVSESSSFEITGGPNGAGCPTANAFAPSFDAGTTSPLGGVFSPFGLRVARSDGEQELRSLDVTLPDGLLAKLAGVPLCPQAAITSTSANCPAGSKVGTVDAGAGAGSTPFFLRNQPVYLTEGYKGAPYGLAVVNRVVAGPFDLGTVVVRQALHVDPDDAHVTVVSDPFPRILQGIPLDIRSVVARVNRPGFTKTPTDCAAQQIHATIRSVQGQTVNRSTAFQVSRCSRLGFKPRLAMRLTGRRHTRTGGHPGIRAVLTQPPGQAGIERTEVRLPSSLALDTKRAASDSLCDWRESLKDEPNCPVSSVIGKARAFSPLLNRPLEGPVYFAKRKRVNSFGREIATFPALVIALRGEVDLNVRANTTVKPGALTTTFPALPDAPVSRFELTLAGAKKGILLVTKTSRGRKISLCAKRQIAEADIDAHNGRRADQNIRIKTPCRNTAKAKKGQNAKRGTKRQ